jgi:hypothetical protein
MNSGLREKTAANDWKAHLWQLPYVTSMPGLQRLEFTRDHFAVFPES